MVWKSGTDSSFLISPPRWCIPPPIYLFAGPPPQFDIHTTPTHCACHTYAWFESVVSTWLVKAGTCWVVRGQSDSDLHQVNMLCPIPISPSFFQSKCSLLSWLFLIIHPLSTIPQLNGHFFFFVSQLRISSGSDSKLSMSPFQVVHSKLCSYWIYSDSAQNVPGVWAQSQLLWVELGLYLLGFSSDFARTLSSLLS